jgi:hypothetical protein
VNLHKLTAEQMAGFQAESLIAVDEWTKAKLTYRDFKAPGKRFLYKSVWFRSNVVLTRRRFFATAYKNLDIDVPLTDDKFKSLTFTVEKDRLLVAFDAGLFQPAWSGRLEYRFTVRDAAAYVAHLNAEAANG